MARYTAQSAPYQSGVLSAITALRKYEGTSIFPTMFGWSLLTHLMVVGALSLLLFLLQFFGFRIPLFEPQALPERDIEFTLVENPNEQKPLNPNARLRSAKNSRSGGTKVANRPVAQMIRAAGAPSKNKSSAATSSPSPQQAPRRSSPPPGPKAQQQPQKQAQRPQPQQQPQRRPQQRQQAAPTPKQQTQPKASAPQPKAPVPPTNTPQVADVPTPSAPKIRLPGAPKVSAPKAIATGPVAPTYTPGSGSGSQSDSGGSAVGPSQIPGTLSGGGGSGNRGQAGSPGGARAGRSGSAGGGGRGSYEQYGSPGGGGGRDGVDAVAAPDYGAYMAELQRRIKRNWHPPQAQEDKRVVVNFSIDRGGRLLGLSIGKSSGYPEADQAAMAAVKLSAPFRSLPPGHRDNDLAIQFTFDYNVYRGGIGGFNYR